MGNYTFSITAASKADAKTAIAAEFDRKVGADPVVSRARAAVVANAGAVIDLLGDDDNADVTVQCSVFNYTADDGEGGQIARSGGVSAFANHVARPVVVLTEADSLADLNGTPRPDNPTA
ncbi:hypothetical protein BcepIL02_gp48 [Burkholderia phage BcepIL02]|uniref:Uncharacterized protein n=1 Tax=Burkholderia phage BcepIL02 TaxID=2886898 RepID=C5IHP0_9CAUD|nr:hypothetical protein BcepIL02_gp48 [Burkholderia phage BcepIL02]ACR15041.1 hypothetical protein BcepIL02_gp48 [Burkholderia phage BcepIL02]